MEPLKHIFLGIIIDNNHKRVDFDIESTIKDRDEIVYYVNEFLKVLMEEKELKFDGKTRMVSSSS
jgi:hypothetical protein